LLTTDRLAIKIYAFTASGTDSITLKWSALTDSGFDLPTPPASVADFVPYQNATANVFLDSYGLSGTFISATGNVTGGNILTAGIISATGNITGNYYIGNGAFLTGINSGSNIANGSSNISIPVASGNIAISVGGVSNTAVINLGSFLLNGAFAGPKTLNANVVVADSVNAMLLGPISIGAGYNISVPTSSTLYVYAP
jgi:hypothetical protein